MDLRTVAVERIGNEYRVYGPFRLVKYARFIIDQFQPQNAKVKAQYSKQLFDAVNRNDVVAVQKIENKVAKFRNKFFGRDIDLR